MLGRKPFRAGGVRLTLPSTLSFPSQESKASSRELSSFPRFSYDLAGKIAPSQDRTFAADAGMAQADALGLGDGGDIARASLVIMACNAEHLAIVDAAGILAEICRDNMIVVEFALHQDSGAFFTLACGTFPRRELGGIRKFKPCHATHRSASPRLASPCYARPSIAQPCRAPTGPALPRLALALFRRLFNGGRNFLQGP